MGANFRFTNKDDPNYCPQYGTTFTERQQRILDGLIPLDEVRLTELSVLIRKSESMHDLERYDIACALYEQKTDRGEYFPQYTAAEAKRILEQLTPWKIVWRSQ